VDLISVFPLLLIVPAGLLLWRLDRRTLQPIGPLRRRMLLVTRTACVALALAALSGPAIQRLTRKQTVIFILDHSRSQGNGGLSKACGHVNDLATSLPGNARAGVLSAGRSGRIVQLPSDTWKTVTPDTALLEKDGGQTDLAAAVSLACGLFPPGSARRVVLLTDGLQTKGDLEHAAREASVSGVTIDVVPIAGRPRPDVRVVRLTPSRARLHEGASVELKARIASSLSGKGTVRLFENGVEVASRPLEVEAGREYTETFLRAPEHRNMYAFQVRVEGFPDDTMPANNSAMTLVDVWGRPVLLYVEGEEGESKYLRQAMAKEGIRLETRPPAGIPRSLQELAAYDGIILSDTPAHLVKQKTMALIRDYVEQLGGGFLMIGGKNAFGVGGYYRTPIEDILPVKVKAKDREERPSSALVLVVDRSGSMSGQKIEICKSAAAATVELLSRRDYVGVVTFDSAARWAVPITRASSRGTIAAQISAISAGGGTNIHPGMTAAEQALASVKAKVKHMIVLSDGRSTGGGYQMLAARMHAKGITISTVAVGSGADTALLQAIAAAGTGKFYFTADPTNIPRIFAKDAMVHMGRLVHEEAFAPKRVERHPMLKGWIESQVPSLLGYVKTSRKATAQVPLVTPSNDPLLAHWRFGLGKVTAFTSDCKSRWASLWLTSWPDYGRFWGQVLREMAREPQGYRLDVRLDEEGEDVHVIADVLDSLSDFGNETTVQGDFYFLPAHSLSSGMEHINACEFEQEGPGRYGGRFRPADPGLYLVRVRSGGDMVSAGFVHDVSSEAATGDVDRGLLERVCKLTGGRMLANGESLERAATAHSHYVEMRDGLLVALLLLFLADVLIRRWEHLLGLLEQLKRG